MDKKNKRVYLSNTKEERAININQFFTLYVDFSKNNTEMKSTITTPDELTTLRIEGSSGTYKIFSSFRPMESPAFVDAVDRKYNLAEIKNLSGGKGYFLVHLNREQQETIQEDLNAILCDSVPCLL
ncbi:hypothetical protein BOVA208_395 [Bacteroides ovatus]|nr:hypothetical protein BOVA208_395 [Bacteroides ovatus]